MSKARIQIREVSPLLKKVREFLLGRPHTLALRFDPDVATRNPPQPDIPDGPSHRLDNNYYCTRDGRSLVQPPEVVATNTDIKLLESGKTGVQVRNRLPGNVWQWD
ncbi:NADH dehydrogenase [ubiquinone] 1 alpha subcomplex subunit 7-like [Coccinella septempunctata]|uniref:NADH dehydrogenase [ubiquinone] 1 alpha subcomplex subunit 7-like n=1 Tax=Coccinella septempunctata TaxID=41139 RepID=UPI001D090E93|nr:NADH dehydrogenase [ubiquinone] 1 alpha subcomplex subunit 7-like [Coccinella septempunctata]